MMKLHPFFTLFLLLISTIGFSQLSQPDRFAATYSDLPDAQPADTLFRIFQGERYELGVPCGYINRKGDTIIPIGKYSHCFTDTFTTFGIVSPKGSSEIIGIDQNENLLYEVYWFDNGPDYLQEGLFRILRSGKIGYADASGQIVIQPQFSCAMPFKSGRAKVAYECELIADGEHRRMESNSWFYIDRSGQKIQD